MFDFTHVVTVATYLEIQEMFGNGSEVSKVSQYLKTILEVVETSGGSRVGGKQCFLLLSREGSILFWYKIIQV